MRTVFHVSSPVPDDRRHAMVNVRNLLDDESVSRPGDEVAVVANGDGVFMVVGATAERPDLVETLVRRGVSVLACRNSLGGRDVSDDDLLPGVEGVPSGAGALARLQDDGYGYIKAP